MLWATREALEAETSGYFLIPPGPLPKGWRSVDDQEGATVWGKGQTSGNDGRSICPNDLKTSGGVCRGMAVPSVRLMMRYNHRDSFQPANFNYSNFGAKWTCDWISYITDNPSNTLANAKFYPPGGGEREFAGFDVNKQAFLSRPCSTLNPLDRNPRS